jgi:hypothetical protein
MDSQPKPLGQLPQQFQKMSAVGVLPVDGFLLIAAGGDVIAATRAFDA